MSLIFYLLALVAAVSLCIVAFLIVSSGDLTKFKNTFRPRARNTILPIVTRYGDLITSPQELDYQLSGLKARLREKYQEFESFKAKVHAKMEHLQKFDHYKKGYYEMQANLVKIEDECKDLQQRVEYMKKVQVRVQEDFSPDVGFMGDAIVKISL